MRIASYVLFIVFIFVTLWFVCWKLMFNYDGKTKLKLHLFRQIYFLNPERWSYDRCNWDDDIKHLYYRGNKPWCCSDYYRVKLSFIAFLWFLYYQCAQGKRSREETQNEYLIHILKNSQKDIARLKAQSEEQIASALREQKRILENWK